MIRYMWHTFALGHHVTIRGAGYDHYYYCWYCKRGWGHKHAHWCEHKRPA
jgi:hypothetical protein